MSHRSAHPHEGAGRGSRPHVKWITIVGVVLMLVAILVYVLSLDEALVPGQAPQQRVPAAAP